jgi:hypothetical protein
VDFWMALIALAICVGLLALTAPLTRISGRSRFLALALALPAAVSLCTPAGAARAAEVFGVDIVTRLDTASSHDTYGLVLSLWRDAFLQAKESPEDYGRSTWPPFWTGMTRSLSTLENEEPRD